MLARLRIQPRVLPRPAAPDPPPHRVSTGHVRPSNGDQDARTPHRSPPRGRQHRLSAIHHPLSAHRHGSTPCVWTRTTLLIPSQQAATPRANSGTALHAEHPPAGTPSVHAADGVSCMRCFLPLWPPALKHPSACRQTLTVTARARPRPAPPLHPGPSSSSASGRRSAARAPDCPPSPAAA